MRVSKVVFILCAVFWLIGTESTAQFLRQWVARYSGTLGNGSDVATAIAVDDSGNVYVTGWTTRKGTATDFATIKYDSDGQQIWIAIQDSGSIDKAIAIAIDTVHDFLYVTGSSGNSIGSLDYLTVKYDLNGNKIWAVKYNGPANGEDQPVAIVTNDSMNVYVTGRSAGVGTGFDYATIKYDSTSRQIWEKRYDGPSHSDDRPYAMTRYKNTELYVTGGSIDTLYDYFTIRYSAISGDSIWGARYKGPGNANDVARAIVRNASTTPEIYVTGGSQDSVNGYDIATIKYNSTGVAQWIRRYDGGVNNDDQGYAISFSTNVYVTGKSIGLGSSNDIVTIRYSSVGHEDYVSRFNGTGNDDDVGIAVIGATNAFVLGSSVGNGTSRDYTLIQYKSNGSENWNVRYNGFGNSDDVPYAMATFGGAVYVTGSSIGKSTDFLTIKYVDADNMKFRTFTQDSLIGKSVNLRVVRARPKIANVRDTAFARAFPKIKRGYIGAPGAMLLGNVYLDSGAYGWIRLDNGTSVSKFVPHTGRARGFDSLGGKPFIGEKKNPTLSKYNNHLVGELIALRINIGASDAEVTPLTFGDLTYDLTDSVNGIPLKGKSLRQIASLVDNFLTYWPRYPTINWALLDSVLSRTNRSFTGPLRIVTNQPLVVTGVVPIGNVSFLKPGVAPLLEPLAFEPGSLEEIPKQYTLYQNYPNPFNPVTTIEFVLPEPSRVTIKVYDILGREVALLVDNVDFDEGLQDLQFDASNFASGIYFYQIIVNNGEFHQVKKMMLIK